MLKTIITFLFLSCIFHAEAQTPTPTEHGTTVDNLQNSIAITTTNFSLANSLHNSYHIIEYYSFDNGETGQKEYIFIFKKTSEAAIYIQDKMDKLSISKDISNNLLAKR